MPIFASARLKRIALVALLTLALLSALPLTADAHADSVFISIRLYAGVDPADQAEIHRQTVAGFVPIMRGSDGFVGYYVLPAGDRLAAVSLFQAAEQASASNENARDFVAAKLAPLLPNPPLIVEGSVDIAFVEMLDGMGAGDVSQLHASLRFYDGFEAADRDEFVAIVEEGFLPIMRETAGFFGYYLMNDGAGAVAAVSIFDSEASAQASNEKARDFVAENLAAFLPNAPQITSGRVGIAMLAQLNDGADLIGEPPVFVSVRLYDGINPDDQDEIARLTDEGFLPRIRERDGFVGYYFLPVEDMLATVSLFDSAEQASASNDAARDFIVANLAPLLPNPPAIFEGSLAINVVPALGGSDDYAAVDELHASIRLYQGFDLTHFDEAVDLANARLLPTLHELGGLFAQHSFDDGEDTVIGISVFDSEAAALAANEAGKAFTIEHLAEWAPNPPSGLSGKLAIAALAEVNMGENLAGAMMGG